MKAELLIPAGSLEILKTAVRYGADAVYVGGESLSLRAKAPNFTREQMREGMAYARKRGVKLYVAVNIIAHNADMDAAPDYLRDLGKLRPDALIIADPGLFLLARQICPEIPIHISTQAGSSNHQTFNFWHGQGAKLVVAARELSLAEIAAIRVKIPADMQMECFVHGAMCMAYSGRCLLSAWLAGRSANSGECAHPCRWQYGVVEQTRPGVYMPLYEDERGSLIFSPHDLCMIGHIPELTRAGINSFKVEGRMKGVLYVATVARVYRKALDDFYVSEELYRDNMHWYMSELARCAHRPYSTGFYFGRQGALQEGQHAESSTAGRPLKGYISEAVYIGTVEAIDSRYGARITQKNKFAVGDAVEIMKPGGETMAAHVRAIYDTSGAAMHDAPHAKQELYINLSTSPEAGDVLRAVEREEIC